MKYEKLFTPGKIGKLEVRNRIVMEPHQTGLTGLGKEGGVVTEEYLAYYRRRSEGGVGLIITELACVDSITGLQSKKTIRADADYSIAEFQKLADAIHPGGAKCFVQINHPGSEANNDLVARANFVSAGKIISKRTGLMTRPLTVKEIHEKIGRASCRERV